MKKIKELKKENKQYIIEGIFEEVGSVKMSKNNVEYQHIIIKDDTAAIKIVLFKNEIKTHEKNIKKGSKYRIESTNANFSKNDELQIILTKEDKITEIENIKMKEEKVIEKEEENKKVILTNLYEIKNEKNSKHNVIGIITKINQEEKIVDLKTKYVYKGEIEQIHNETVSKIQIEIWRTINTEMKVNDIIFLREAKLKSKDLLQLHELNQMIILNESNNTEFKKEYEKIKKEFQEGKFQKESLTEMFQKFTIKEEINKPKQDNENENEKEEIVKNKIEVKKTTKFHNLCLIKEYQHKYFSNLNFTFPIDENVDLEFTTLEELILETLQTQEGFSKKLLDSLKDKSKKRKNQIQMMKDEEYLSINLIIHKNTDFSFEFKKETSNRTIREFGSDSLLSISFSIPSEETNQIIMEGFPIFDRKYEVIRKSVSIKETKYIFFYHKDFTVNDYINWSGDYSQIKEIGKYGSRLKLSLSTTTPTIVINQDMIKNFEDIESIDKDGNKYCFTDGCGEISNDLMIEVSKSLNAFPFIPSAIQIRLLGFKGMLVLNPKLDEKTINIRPSMKKFEIKNPTKNQLTIEVINFSKPKKTISSLNQQIIKLLNYNSTDNENNNSNKTKIKLMNLISELIQDINRNFENTENFIKSHKSILNESSFSDDDQIMVQMNLFSIIFKKLIIGIPFDEPKIVSDINKLKEYSYQKLKKFKLNFDSVQYLYGLFYI
jgi:hypothetical protein